MQCKVCSCTQQTYTNPLVYRFGCAIFIDERWNYLCLFVEKNYSGKFKFHSNREKCRFRENDKYADMVHTENAIKLTNTTLNLIDVELQLQKTSSRLNLSLNDRKNSKIKCIEIANTIWNRTQSCSTSGFFLSSLQMSKQCICLNK